MIYNNANIFCPTKEIAMNRPLLRLILALLVLLVLIPCGTQAGNKPVVVSHDETYANRAIRFRVAWQSENPVVVVKIFTGKDQKEIKIDEYDNKRTRDGYSVEVSAIIELDPMYVEGALPFAIQVEDDTRLKSDEIRGKVQIVRATKQDDDWGREKLASQPTGQLTGQTGGSNVEILDRVVGLIDRYDMAPNLGNILINRVGTDGVSISTKATDDKALREVNFRIYDMAGNIVQLDTVSTTGRVWEGTSKVFNLINGNYKAVIQATDGAGNTSAEKTEFFSITGSSLATQPPMMQQPSSPFPGTVPTGQQPPGQWPGTQQPAAQLPGAQQPPGQWPGAQQPGAQLPGAPQPGVQQQPEQWPTVQQPGAQQPPGWPTIQQPATK
jgi:hypothetical protein